MVPLYVETNPERGAAELPPSWWPRRWTGQAGQRARPSAARPVTTQSVIRFGVGAAAYPAEEILPRRSAAISEGGRVSFGTYFNAFPASYWRRWTTVDSVTLRIRVAGRVHDHPVPLRGQGAQLPGRDDQVETDEPVSVERTLPLAPFIDGGWYWFDIVAGPRGTTADRGGVGRAGRAGGSARAGSASASPRSTGPTSWSSTCAPWATRRRCST